jgi:hypothetical protein
MSVYRPPNLHWRTIDFLELRMHGMIQCIAADSTFQLFYKA